jgi:hypothetical protein
MSTPRIQLELASISVLSAHYVGNKNNGDMVKLSDRPVDIDDDQMTDLLHRYFLGSFTNPELYSLTSSTGDFALNPLYQLAKTIFGNKQSHHEQSQGIAKLLFDASMHPQIKSGDLFIAYIRGVVFDNQELNAIGIFKSESKQSFLKLYPNGNNFDLFYDSGINVEKLDKGCLIINTEEEDGYRICIVDRTSRAGEAQFWKDDFLHLKPVADEYSHTKQFLDIAKTYVTTQYKEDFVASKTDEIDLLHRSIDYFKSHDEFDQKEFEKEVFHHPETIASFQNFDKQFREAHDIEIEPRFEISSMAVKKQQKVFKSILKLDKNFHIYIHGNPELIQPGVEPDGRKYYKVYYNEETN